MNKNNNIYDNPFSYNLLVPDKNYKFYLKLFGRKLEIKFISKLLRKKKKVEYDEPRTAFSTKQSPVSGGISMRATGDIKEAKEGFKVDSLKFITYDYVIYPSHRMKPIHRPWYIRVLNKIKNKWRKLIWKIKKQK